MHVPIIARRLLNQSCRPGALIAHGALRNLRPAIVSRLTCPLTDIAAAREATRSFLGSLRARE